jgi:hypothetical protein
MSFIYQPWHILLVALCGWGSQTLSIFRGQFKRLTRHTFQFGFQRQGFMLQTGDLSSLSSFHIQ